MIESGKTMTELKLTKKKATEIMSKLNYFERQLYAWIEGTITMIQKNKKEM